MENQGKPNRSSKTQTGRGPIVVGITGASGAIYGVRLVQALEALRVATHLVLTAPGRTTLEAETGLTAREVQAMATVAHPVENLAAPIASGSFATGGMVVAPCSIKSLSAIAHSYADNLLVRAADVTLKEGRPLILMVREAPLHLGHLRLMVQAAELGAVIFPPMPAFYTQPATLEELVDHSVGRVLARLGVPNDLFAPWEGVSGGGRRAGRGG